MRRAIHPGGGQSSRAAGFNIQQWIVTDVDDFVRLEPEGLHQPLETTPIRLGGTDAARIQRDAEEVRDADPVEIRIAVAERRKRKAGAQARQSRTHIGIQIELVALRNENLESLLGNALVIATLARMLRKRSNSQIGEVVSVVRLACRQCQPRGAQIIDGQPLGDAGAVLAQPLQPAGFRPRNHRIDFPERIIQVESDSTDHALMIIEVALVHSLDYSVGEYCDSISGSPGGDDRRSGSRADGRVHCR